MGLGRYWVFAAVAFTLMAPQAQAQINPFVGRSEPGLSSHDLDLMMGSVNRVNLAPHVAVGTTAAWSNPKTGDHGTSTVERIFHEHGRTCHLLRHDIVSREEPQPQRYYLTWCQTPDGAWKILR